MGSSQIQGELWSARAREWAELQEGSLRPLYEAAFTATHVGNGTALLDVGCGAGLALATAQTRGAEVSGLDAAAGLAELARSRRPGADILVGDIEELPFGDGNFDVTTGFNSFQYASDPVHASDRGHARNQAQWLCGGRGVGCAGEMRSGPLHSCARQAATAAAARGVRPV